MRTPCSWSVGNAEILHTCSHSPFVFVSPGNGDTTNPGSAVKVPLRCKWAEGEVEAFLNIIIKHKLQAPLLRKRNAKVFKLLAREMAKRGFAKRPDQLRVKYHQLRRQYAKAKNGGETFEHFEDMHALLNGSVQHGESSAGERESDSNDSGEEDVDAAIGSESESEGSLIRQSISLPSFYLCFNPLQAPW